MTAIADIKSLFDNSPTYASRRLAVMPELLKLIEDEPGETLSEKAFNKINPGSYASNQVCPVCNKKTANFRGFFQGYQKFCSSKCSRNSIETQEKAISTCLTRYGVTNPYQAKATKDKYRAAMLSKYGVLHAFQAESTKAAVRATNLEKYGTEHMFSSERVKANARAAKTQQYIELSWHERLQIIEKEQGFVLTEFQEHEPLKIFNWRHSCGHEQASAVTSGRVLSCNKCKHRFVSKGEDEVAEFLANYTIVYRNVRSVIGGELDVYCPELNLAIEYNGLYWHSDEYKTSDYHLIKTEACESKGIKLIQIFEDEWNEKQLIVKSRLLSAIKKAKRIYARTCKIINVSAADSMRFQRETHVQGSVGSSVRLGLIHEGALVALMTFGKPRFNRSFDWELLRYSTSLNNTVIGGPSKLLKAFRLANSGSIISYADRRWSDGNLYRTLGMKQHDASPPGFMYVINGERKHRLGFQKHTLNKVLGSKFKPELTAEQNMQLAGYNRVYDCGSHVFSIG